MEMFSTSPNLLPEKRLRKRRRAPRRAGYVLILFVMMVFALMAMAALVIDLGIARLTQRQMQTASDSAALEGLRGLGMDGGTYAQRQDAAERMIEFHFDDDLDPTTDQDTSLGARVPFGAGPLIEFQGSEGDPSLFASQLMSVDRENAVYQPTLERSGGAIEENRFRVHLQRGGSPNGQADLFDVGPSIPYLFARGSLIERSRIGSGISVEATSRARGSRALRVGFPVVSNGTELIPGVIQVGYLLDDWNGARTSPFDLTPFDLPPGITTVSIGQLVENLGTVPSSLPDGYCPIFIDDSSRPLLHLRIVGFGCIEQGAAKTGNYVARGNAQAFPGEAWSTLPSDVRGAVWSESQQVQNPLRVATIER